MEPINKYKKGTVSWNLMNGDWADLTPRQISEVLGVTKNTIYINLSRIKNDTGYNVPRKKGKSTGRPQKER